MALVRSDPFRDVDRLFQQLLAGQNGVRSMAMPLDAYRKNDSFLIRLDLPGVRTDSIELTVEDNVLTIKADRPAPPASKDRSSDHRASVRHVRSSGVPRHQLDTENIKADYEAGVSAWPFRSPSMPSLDGSKSRLDPISRNCRPDRGRRKPPGRGPKVRPRPGTSLSARTSCARIAIARSRLTLLGARQCLELAGRDLAGWTRSGIISVRYAGKSVTPPLARGE